MQARKQYPLLVDIFLLATVFNKGKSMNQHVDFGRLSAVCGWLNTLPVYMFSGELTAALVLFAYERSDLGAVDHAARIVLNFQASLEAPLTHEQFIEMVEQVMDNNPPASLVEFLARETTH